MGKAGLHHHVAYGLRIRSALALPELDVDADQSRLDIDIRFGDVVGPLPGPGLARLVEFERDGAYFAWPQIGRFRIGSAGVVTIDRLTDDDQAIRFALLGPVLAGALQLAGHALLHGSAVAHAGGAILIVGRKGAGKSSLAAAFGSTGCAILNDDVLPIRLVEGAATLITGFPAIKLTPHARNLFLPDSPDAPSGHANPDEKMFVRFAAHGIDELPVGAVVVIDSNNGSGPAPMSPFDALPELLQHGYSIKFGEHALSFGQDAALFAACAHVAQHARAVRTGRVVELSQLPGFARMLVADEPATIEYG